MEQERFSLALCNFKRCSAYFKCTNHLSYFKQTKTSSIGDFISGQSKCNQNLQK